MSHEHDTPPSDPPQRFLPLILRETPRWCRWRLQKNRQGQWTKRPDCSTRDEAARRPFAAVKGPMTEREGIGFITGGGVKTPRGFLVAIDYDNCVSAREPSPWAAAAVKAFGNSFTEISPSGFGLRQWVLVERLPQRNVRGVFPVDEDPVPGCKKRVEVQLFGTKDIGGGYVTVTGDHLAGTHTDVVRIPSIDAIFAHFDVPADVAGGGELAELPEGKGEPPSPAEIDLAVRGQPNGTALAEGRWEVTDAASASDAFFELTQRALIAARGHGQAALDYLLDETAWGLGDIEGSLDPAKYQSEAWVTRDLLRAAGKTGAHETATGEEFDEIPDDLPEVAAPTLRQLAMPARQWIETVGQLSFILRDFLPRQGTFQVIGDPGGGKSQFMLSLAMAITTGAETWFGHKLERHGSVLFLVGEGRAGFASRIRAEALRRGIEVPDNLFVSVAPAELDNPKELRRWLKWLKQVIPDLVLVVVDTQTSNTSGEFEENDVKGVKVLLAHGNRIADALRCCVGFVHHTGHQHRDRARGSSAQKGAIDCDFLVTKVEKEAMTPDEVCTSNGDAIELTLTPVRTKDWPQGQPVVGSVRSVPLGNGLTAPVLVEQPVSAVPIEAFDADDTSRLFAALVETIGRPVGRAELARRSGLSEKVVRREMAVIEREHEYVTSRRASGRGKQQGMIYELTEAGLAAAVGSGLLESPDSNPGENTHWSQLLD